MHNDSRIRRSNVLDELTKTLKLAESTLTSHTFAWSLIADWEGQVRRAPGAAAHPNMLIDSGTKST